MIIENNKEMKKKYSNLCRNDQTGLILDKGETVKQWFIELDSPILKLQEALHSLLVNFVNATDIPPTRTMIPMKYVRIPRSRYLQIAVESLHVLGANTLFLSLAASETSSSPMMLAKAIAEGYEVLKAEFLKETKVSWQYVKSGIDRNEWIVSIHEQNFLPVLELVDELVDADIPGVSSFWLHGSIATLDYVRGYSDCDATVILNKDSITDANSLICLRNKLSYISCALHNIDPLQHHGLFVLTEYDLQSYQQSFFPLEIIERSVEIISGVDKVEYNESGLGYASERSLFLKMAQQMRSVACGKTHLRTAYAIKAHVQTLVLMWVIYLQLRDEKFWHKQDALQNKHDEIPSEIWLIIENVTHLRQSWNVEIHLPLLKKLGLWNSRLPPAILRAISLLYANNLRDRLLDDWECACMRFSEFLLADLRIMGKL